MKSYRNYPLILLCLASMPLLPKASSKKTGGTILNEESAASDKAITTKASTTDAVISKPAKLSKKQSAPLVVTKPHYPEQKKIASVYKSRKQPSKSEMRRLIDDLERENSRLRDEVIMMKEKLADEELHRERERYEAVRRERRLRAEIRNLRKFADADEDRERRLFDDCPPGR